MGDPVEAPVQCTCGNRLNNLTYEKWKVDHGSNEPTLDESNLSNITSPGRLKTDFFQNPGTSKTTPMPFDASFIQVKPPFPGCSTIFAKTLSYPNHMFDGSNHFATKDNLQTEAAPPNNCQADFLLRDSNLCKAATSDTDPPPLCMSCLRRVEKALDTDSERLHLERSIYMDAIFEDTSRDKSLRKALQISANNRLEGEEVLSEIPQLSTETSLANVEQKTEEAFRQEIQFLEAACQQYGSELLHLRALAKEHAMLSRELDDMQEAIAEDQISLELEARAFDNDQQRLSRELVDIEDEVDRLSSPEIRLPATTLHLQVDVERGLRYPLINELRLAYRPKGDVHWEEIQAAWALAADLLLVIASVFEFQSQHWKIVPLSHCAKLIYRLPSERGINATDNPKAQDNKPRLIVFNIGHPKTNGSKALLAWNGLMYQVIQHVQNHISDATENGVLEREEIPPLPVQISSTGIGGTALPQLDDGDDFGWSRAINCMALDLLWLSDCASTFVLKRVLMQAALSTGKTVLQTE